MKALVGPANSGKSQWVLSQVANSLSDSRGALLLVPSNSAALVMSSRLQSLTGLKPEGQALQVVTTFPNLYYRILSREGVVLNWLNTADRFSLLRDVIGELNRRGALLHFSAIAGTQGFSTGVASFIDELWRSGTDPATFLRIARSRRDKDSDLAKIFEAYSNELAMNNATDAEAAGVNALRELKMRVAGKKVSPVKPASAEYNLSIVAADGFDYYTPVQIGILALLSKLGIATMATLTYRPGCSVHLWQEPTYRRFEKASADFIHVEPSDESKIQGVANSLFNDPGNVGSKAKSDSRDGPYIKKISSNDRAAEVREVAREIKRLAIKERFELDQMTVVCRSFNHYARHLERVFDECEIPLWLDCGVGLADHPLVTTLLRIIGLQSDSFRRRSVLACLRSTFFDASVFGLSEADIELLEYISAVENVTGGRKQWREAITRAAGSAPSRVSEDNESLFGVPGESHRARFDALGNKLKEFFEAVSPLPTATSQEHTNWVRELLSTLRVAEIISTGETSALEKRALDSFLRTLDSLCSQVIQRNANGRLRDRSIEWEEFLNDLNRAVEAATFEKPPMTGAAVVAQEVHNLRPQAYRAIFIIGLIEGEFPARVTEPFPYSLQEREQIIRSGIDLTEVQGDAGADIAQFYKAVSRTKERLFLSHPRIDTAGGELLPSFLIEEVRAVAPLEEIYLQPPAARSHDLLNNDVASLEELAWRTARGLLMGESDGRAPAACNLLNSRVDCWASTLRCAIAEGDRISGLARGRFSGIVGDAELLDHLRASFGTDHLWSASSLNDYGLCPFRFFSRHALRLSPVEEPGEGFTPNQWGAALHSILEKLYMRLKDEGIRIDAGSVDEAAEMAREVTDRELSKLIEEGRVKITPLWDYEKSDVKRRISLLLNQEAEWNADGDAVPIAFEKNFGIRGQEPLIIEDEDGDVKICGVVDRIDKCEEGLVIIDYKTSRTPIRHDDAVDGRNLQLPIYVMAASRVIEKGSRVASAYYLHINSRKKGSELPSTRNESLTIESMVELAERHIRNYVRQARSGVFPVRPNRGICPNYCEYDVMCRVQSLSGRGEES